MEQITPYIEKIVEFVKGIDWDSVISTVKGIVDKAGPIVEKIIQFISDNVG